MSCSETCTDASENCPKCHVRRAPLNVGGWCVTCGFNPSHAAELADTQAVLAVAEEMAAFLMAESRALHAVLAPGTRNSPRAHEYWVMATRYRAAREKVGK